MEKHKIAAIIVAAGASSRLPGDRPKPYRFLNGRPVLRTVVKCFLSHPAIDLVQVVINPEHRHWYDEALDGILLPPPVPGGAERQESVRLGLDRLAANAPGMVLIHDAARPCITHALIDQVIAGLYAHQAVIPVVPVVDTIKRVEEGRVSETLPRTELVAVQTPQGFHFDIIRQAHARFAGRSLTDDAALAEAAGIEVMTVPGEVNNIKLTTPEDIARMEQWFCHPERSEGSGAIEGDPSPLAQDDRKKETRTGMGFDVHRLVEDRLRPLMICGVEIPDELALAGHSDADVGLHALTDALLGAMVAGDIGEHFPPSDLRWKDADSYLFVVEAMRLLAERQGRVIHADITLICERPKISPYREAMRARVAALLQVEMDRVSIKATTTEGLGFTGRGEGIAAQAVVTISS